MSKRYSDSQATVVDSDNRNMKAAGIAMSDEIDSIWSTIDSGNIGVTADAGDVDSLALGGGNFTRDKATYPGTTLTFGWEASRIFNGLSLVTVSAGSLALAASDTNYVEVDVNGNVTTNNSGFTAGRRPLWIVTTGVSSYADNQVVSVKALLFVLAALTGGQLSTAGRTKEITAQLGASIAATASFYLVSPNVAATLLAARLVNSTAFATSDTDYWTFALANLGPAGTGTTAMLAAGATSTTKTTGGSLLAVGIARSLALNATGANLVTAAGDVLQLTLTKTGSPAALTLSALALDFGFTT